MQVAIPPELERFARESVAAGHVASQEDVASRVLRDDLGEVERDVVILSIVHGRRDLARIFDA